MVAVLSHGMYAVPDCRTYISDVLRCIDGGNQA
jgi:hypothetical protein